MGRGHGCADQRQASAHVTANRKASAATTCITPGVFPQSNYYCLRGCDTLVTQKFTDVSKEPTACIFGVHGCRRFILDHTASHATKKFFIICML